MTGGNIEQFPARYEPNPDGDGNIRLGKEILHSRRNPLKEAERQLAEILQLCHQQPQSLIVYIGVGWGYLIDALRSSPSADLRSQLILVEPSQNVYDLLLASGRLEQLFQSGYRILPGQQLPREIASSGSKTIVLLAHPVYRRIEPELLQQFSPQVDRENANTLHHFSHQWLRNYLCMLRSPPISEPLHYLKATGPLPATPHFPGAIYCGAGPTLLCDLQSILSTLSTTTNDKPLIIASDTALAPLLARGIEPDWVVSVDSGRGTAQHLLKAMQCNPPQKNGRIDINFFTWGAGHRWVRSCFQRVVLYRSLFPLEQLLGQGPLQNTVEIANPSRNVSGLAVILSGLYGVQDLYMAGSGQVVSGGKSHIEGSGYETHALLMQNRLYSAAAYQARGYRASLGQAQLRMRESLNAMARARNITLHYPDAAQSTWIPTDLKLRWAVRKTNQPEDQLPTVEIDRSTIIEQIKRMVTDPRQLALIADDIQMEQPRLRRWIIRLITGNAG